MPSFDLTPANTALLVIDMQEKFLPAIPAIAVDQPCGRNCRILLAAAGLLSVPVTISEQYPQGLGPTLAGLKDASPKAVYKEKTLFSCGDDPVIVQHLASLGRKYVVVAGIEAHVCVLATVADLVGRGTRVVVAGDAVASRREASCDQALTAMRDLGALVVPGESIIFRLQRRAEGEIFKAISKLVR